MGWSDRGVGVDLVLLVVNKDGWGERTHLGIIYHCNCSKISTSESDDPLSINFLLTASARQRSDLILRSLGSGLVHDRTAPASRCSLVRSSPEKPIMIALQPEVRRARMTPVPVFIT